MKLTVNLKNTQSVARDHLANERTFLSWVRTSMTLASVGVACTQLFRLKGADHTSIQSGTILGGLFIGFAIVLTIFGAARYYHVQYKLAQNNTFPISRFIVLATFVLACALITTTLGILMKNKANTK